MLVAPIGIPSAGRLLADAGRPCHDRPVRDRDVVLAAVLVVRFVLAVAWLTGLVPALDNAIGLAPVIIVALVVVTAVVLVRSFRAAASRSFRPVPAR